jgi:hypothetical protein
MKLGDVMSMIAAATLCACAQAQPALPPPVAAWKPTPAPSPLAEAPKPTVSYWNRPNGTQAQLDQDSARCKLAVIGQAELRTEPQMNFKLCMQALGYVDVTEEEGRRTAKIEAEVNIRCAGPLAARAEAHPEKLDEIIAELNQCIDRIAAEHTARPTTRNNEKES